LRKKNEENMQICNFMQHEAIQRFTLKLTEDFHCAVITRMPEEVLCNNSSTMVPRCEETPKKDARAVQNTPNSSKFTPAAKAYKHILTKP
jgi:hypothetical protein